ncbi:MAG TPA: hypothetical protein VFK41_03145 [Nocardioidaceae bacterium]|nr:hypothetical protein [Nocardioidaceae bacterium]
MTTYTRADIGLRPATGGPGRLDAEEVEGIALHWPAISKPLRDVADVKAALRGWQAYHMDHKDWSDIAYQVAVDQAGNRYELRGLATQSGANGDQDVNERFGALLLILAPGEKPTRRMVRGVRRVVKQHRALFPQSRRIVGHSEIRPEPTACPGPAALAAIRAGRFEPVSFTRGHRVDELIRLTREALPHNSGARLAGLKESLTALLAIPRRRK